MTDDLKLYLWENVLCDYTSGVCFALATSIGDARAKVKQAMDSNDAPFGPYTWKNYSHEIMNTEPRVIDGPFGFALRGGG